MNDNHPEHIDAHTQALHQESAHSRSRFFLCISVLTGLLFAILISITPHGADDLLFLLPAKGLQPGPGLWDMMTGEFPRIWETQSGRLGNFLAMPFLYLMPKWVFGVITGILTTSLILLSCRATGTRRGSIISWLMYATLVFAFPWYDYLTLVTYAINYLWAATAVSAAIVCFLHVKTMGGFAEAATCVLMFIAGWMHEGFGAPLTAGLTLCIIILHRKTSRRQLLAWICAVAGTFMTALSPVFWQRSERETNFLLKFTYKELIMQIGPALLFVIVLVLLLLFIYTRRASMRPVLKQAPLLIFVGAAFASTAVFLKYYTGPRTGAPVILYSMLACGYILTSVGHNLRIPKGIQWTSGALISGLSIVHLTYAAVSQAERTKEFEEATHLYEESSDGIFYYDIAYPVADLTLFKTSVRQFHEKVPKEFMRMYYKPEHKMVILPTAMRGFSPETATESAITPGVLLYNGWIVLSDTVSTDAFQRIHILTGDGKYLPSRFRIDRFSVKGFGEFQLLTPHIKVLDPSIKVLDVALYDHSR